MKIIEQRLGFGAGHLYIEPDQDKFSMNLRPLYGGSEYRIVGITVAQLTNLIIELVAVPEIRETLSALRKL